MKKPKANNSSDAKHSLERTKQKTILLYAVLFAIAFVPRLLHVLLIADNPFFNFPIIDAQTNDSLAQNIAQGRWLENKPFWQAPLYPYFLGLIYSVFGRDLFLVRIIQILLGSVNCLLLHHITRTVFNARIALVSFLVAAFYAPFIFFDAELLNPVLVIFFNLLVVSILLSFHRGPRVVRLFWAGLILGLSSVTHGLAVTFLPLALLWIIILIRRSRLPAPNTLRSCLSLLAGFLLVISVTTVRNLVVGKDLVFVSSNAGINFFIGNNPDYDRTTSIRPGVEWEELIQRPIQEGFEKPSERSRYFWKQAFSYMAGQPFSYFKLLAKKLYLTLDGYEIKRNQDLYAFRGLSLPLKLLLWKWLIYFPFGLSLPLSIVGIVVFFRERRSSGAKDLRPILILYFLLSQAVALLFFFISARYRLPLVPFLIILAVLGFYGLYERFKISRTKEVLLLLAIFLVFLVVSNISRHEVTDRDLAEEHYNLGMIYGRQEKFNQAIQEYEMAVRLQPDHVMAHFKIALAYHSQDMLQKAEEKYLQVIEIFPRSALAYNNLGMIYENRGDLLKAEEFYIKASDAHPLLPDPHYNLGNLFAMQGSFEFAKQSFIDCLAADPSYYKAYNGLGELHFSRGELDEAMGYFKKGIKLQPGYAVLHNNLGAAYAQKGQRQMAFLEFEAAIKLDPDYGSAHLNLGNWYLEEGNTQKAIPAYERAAELIPDDPRVHYYLAIAYGTSGRESDALTELRRALSADSTFAPARELLQKVGGQ